MFSVCPGGGNEEAKPGRVTSSVGPSSQVFCLQQRWWMSETHEEGGL